MMTTIQSMEMVEAARVILNVDIVEITHHDMKLLALQVVSQMCQLIMLSLSHLMSLSNLLIMIQWNQI